MPPTKIREISSQSWAAMVFLVHKMPIMQLGTWILDIPMSRQGRRVWNPSCGRGMLAGGHCYCPMVSPTSRPSKPQIWFVGADLLFHYVSLLFHLSIVNLNGSFLFILSGYFRTVFSCAMAREGFCAHFRPWDFTSGTPTESWRSSKVPRRLLIQPMVGRMLPLASKWT